MSVFKIFIVFAFINNPRNRFRETDTIKSNLLNEKKIYFMRLS